MIHPDFNIIHTAYQGPNTIAYQALRQADQLKVILKTHVSEYPSLKELANLKHEYTLLKEISYPGIIQVYDLVKYQNRFFLVMEDTQGVTLRQWMGSKHVKLDNFYTIALQLVNITSYLHSHQLIHKDIKPENILINPENLQVTIIDFSLSVKLSFETSNLVNPNVLEGTLAYISPEQTGRMNRLVDHRSDFYSLGITFYEMLAGKVPFMGSDPLELVYAHLAKMAIPLYEVNSKIPKSLSAIVAKLMAKSSDDRYLTGAALKEDLLESQKLFLEGKPFVEFDLGKKEIKSTLIISQKLYGRESESDHLLNIFENISKTGKSELTLVSGYSGIGKSAFIQEIYKPLSRQKGYFIRGKFDLLQRNTSYFGFKNAFKELINHVLTETEWQLDSIREEILKAVGPNGQLVIDLVPELELVIGKQKTVAELQPKEALNRFNFVVQAFINVFAKKTHPLVVFIDDLQWADHASLALLEHLLQNTQYLFVIGAYRDNEVTGHHPLLMTIDFLKKEQIPLTIIKLEPLHRKNVGQLIKDSLDQDNIEELIDLTMDKTRGNPFFINEFLKSIFQENLLTISKKGLWQWDLMEINKKAITSNVVDLMVGKIQKLPIETQKILALASCIGSQFDLTTLATASEISPVKVSELLWPAVQAGLILTIGSGYKQASLLDERESSELIQYKFLHDRVQEAAYKLISIPERKQIHLAIGRHLLKKEGNSPERLLEILGHFNYSLDLVNSIEEKSVLAELNVMAGKKTKASSAYTSAITYFEAALSLLPENAWDLDYTSTFQLNKNFAECEYLVGKFTEAEAHLMQLIDRAKNELDKAEIYSILVVQLTNLGHYARAIKSGVDCLELLGLKIPESPSEFSVLKEVLRLKLKLTFTSARKKLSDLPPMTDPKILKMVQVMYFMAPPTYIYNQGLHILIGLNIVNLVIDHGYTQGALMGFLCYLLVLITKLHDHKEAAFWAGLMVKYAEKAQHIDNYTYFCLGAFYAHWSTPYRDTFDYFKRSIKACIEEGDLNFYAYNSFAILGTVHAMGKPIVELKKSTEDTMGIFKQDLSFFNAFCLNHYLLDCLEHGNEVDEQKVNEYMTHVLSNPYSKTAYVLIYSRLCEFYLMCGESAKALEVAKKGMAVSDNALGFAFQTDCEFYYGIALAANIPNQKGKEKTQSINDLKKVQKTFKGFAAQGPDNYLDKYLFISAEIAIIEGLDKEAEELYDKAIEQSKNQEFIHHAAFISERAALHYLKIGKERLAKLYIQESFYYYTLWGAALKIKMLNSKYSQWLKISKQHNPTLSETTSHSISGTTTISSSHTLDFLSILKANQIISSEIVLSELLKKILKILMENTGGQRGVLLIKKEDSLMVQAESFLEEKEVQIKLQAVSERQDLPLSILAYVQRSLQTIIVNSGAQNQFSHDPYIVHFRPKSILCTPILYQNRLIGLLYLESNASEDTFTTERVELLGLISGQAAISLENAQLYEATGQFVPIEFLEHLGKRSLVDIKLGDQIQQIMSVLFCDIRGFTTIAETMSPADVFSFINDFLGCMEPHIQEHNGFTDKYIGDAIMALFKGQADNAVDAAIAMLKALKQFNITREKPISIGIGINTGDIILGIMGGKNHLAGTVIGDSVNSASRIEGLTKLYGTPLLIGEGTKKAIQDPSSYHMRFIDTVLVKGKSIPIEIWEVCDVDSKESRGLKMELQPLFEQARVAYSDKKYSEAADLFKECFSRNPGDTVSRLYIQRCTEALLNQKPQV
jgi:predicted ATPase/class 3 adenylate cyclase/GAF domain-containing protein/tRNA A-37 threonylcarbamoyl transferase component Bud32